MTLDPCPICGAKAEGQSRHVTHSVWQEWIECTNKEECGIRLDGNGYDDDLPGKWNKLRLLRG